MLEGRPLKYYRVERNKTTQKIDMIEEGTGTFLGFGLSGDHDSGIDLKLPASVAIIELSDGQVITRLVQLIRFIKGTSHETN